MSTPLALPFTGTSDNRPDVAGFQVIDTSAGVGVEGISTGSNPVPSGQVLSIGVQGISQGVPNPNFPGSPPQQFASIGVRGSSTSGIGVSGDGGTTGVVGQSSGGTGVSGDGSTGVFGVGRINGVHGQSSSVNGSGVFGENNTDGGTGVQGSSSQGEGVRGVSGNPRHGGVVGINTSAGGQGIFGACDNGNGIVGQTRSDTDAGVNGRNSGKGFGVFGGSVNGSGVEGHSTNGPGIVGFSNNGPAGVFHGDVKVTGDIQLTNGEDCAEEFDVSGALEIGPGTVMVINEHGGLQQSARPYDRKVAGVVSGAGGFRPGIVLGKRETSEHRLPIALLGKVYCKVDARLSPIEVGDLLTTSATPGHAMKADDPFRAVGSLIGKALRPLAEGQGLIPILVALQ